MLQVPRRADVTVDMCEFERRAISYWNAYVQAFAMGEWALADRYLNSYEFWRMAASSGKEAARKAFGV